MDDAPTQATRRRRSPAERRAAIVTRAAALVLEQGALPVPLDRLAQELGISKALIYNYFPTQYDLFNAVLDQEFQVLSQGGLEAAVVQTPLDTAAMACAHVYFDHVAERGPVIHLILRDRFMARKLAPDISRFRDRLILQLARASRRDLRLSAKENIAAINLVITIPEEAGRLAYRGDIARTRARELCGELVLSSLRALSPRPTP